MVISKRQYEQLTEKVKNLENKVEQLERNVTADTYNFGKVRLKEHCKKAWDAAAVLQLYGKWWTSKEKSDTLNAAQELGRHDMKTVIVHFRSDIKTVDYDALEKRCKNIKKRHPRAKILIEVNQ